MTTAKELALGGMFTALGVVLLCLGGVVPLALYACPILASAVLLPVRERCSKRVAWNCYAAIAILAGVIGGVVAQHFGYAACFLFAGAFTLLAAWVAYIRLHSARELMTSAID